ncbi:MAG: hypothetical protein MZV65_25045 [Chromatiales bacterium]|nr:hypothetical protein [Chromatiales bacterium]
MNEALRQGLRRMTAPSAPRPPFQTRAVALGRCRLGGIDNIADALAASEGEAFRVILVDANLLIYAHVSTFPQHERARNWLDEQMNGAAPVGLPLAEPAGFAATGDQSPAVRQPRVDHRRLGAGRGGEPTATATSGFPSLPSGTSRFWAACFPGQAFMPIWFPTRIRRRWPSSTA